MGKKKNLKITDAKNKHDPHKKHGKHRTSRHQGRHGLFSKEDVGKIDFYDKANRDLGEKMEELKEAFQTLKPKAGDDVNRYPTEEEEKAFKDLLTGIRQAKDRLSEMEIELKPLVNKVDANTSSGKVKMKK